MLSILCCIIAYRFVYAFYLSPLRKLPGPLLGKLTSLRIELRIARGLITYTGREDSAKYGDLYMCMPNAVAVSHPDDIRTVLGNSAVKKAPYYRIVRFTGVETSLTLQDNKDAGVRHRQIVPYFQPRHLSKMQETIMDQGIHSIMRKWDGLLDQSATGKAEVNYCDDILIAAFGVLSKLVFGRTLDEIKTADAAAARWIERTFKLTCTRAMFQILPSFVAKVLFWPWEHYYTRLTNCAHEAITVRKKLMAKLEAENRTDEKPVDLLQALIDAEDSETGTKMSYEEIHAESMLMMLAGADTTAFTTVWAIHLLMLYPHHYKRAVEEVRSLYKPDHVVTYNECRETLPFVEACIFESLRLFPVVGGMIPRVAPRGGIVLQGHFIPEGTLMFVNMGCANYHSKYWDRPHEYDPTRFIKDKEASRNLLSFSHGRRICPGRYLAWWEMLTILPNILKNYNFELPADYTHLGPNLLDERGLPKVMDAKTFVTFAPTYAHRDCRLVISRTNANGE
ncbi:hypothetical protein H4217_006660 [Coemansia sp. RSA 1939]|nr:hypothetical protein H4217_006660 [Coemansia sp. RSA 1939]KAJ2604815.1 hypothetical protein EV177_006302 [Coemansia sp. RSA 1804]